MGRGCACFRLTASTFRKPLPVFSCVSAYRSRLSLESNRLMSIYPISPADFSGITTYPLASRPSKVTVRDLQSTMLHLLGLDPYRFSYRYQGLNQRLIGPTNEGRVVKEILA